MRVPLVFVALVLVSCAAEPPEAVVIPPVVVERTVPLEPVVDAVHTTEGDVSTWYAAALWNDTVAWNAAEASAVREAARRAPRPSGGTGSYSGSGTVNGYPCGGSLPSCRVLRCESGGSPRAENPRSSASGLWQITDGTWAGFGGYSHAASAPVSVQNQKAAQLWAGGAGAFHWRACL